jgi:hypothetical protein
MSDPSPSESGAAPKPPLASRGPRVIVTGGRAYGAAEKVYAALDGIGPSCVIEGGCRTGADLFARLWVRAQRTRGHAVEHERFDAPWKEMGPGAGPWRNTKMVYDSRAALVLAFPGGRGTADCVRKARAAGIEVREIR